MKVVYATATVVTDQALIREGTHWPATDPLVLANPSLFSDDPRVGLQFTVEPASGDQILIEQPRQKRAYVRHNI